MSDTDEHAMAAEDAPPIEPVQPESSEPRVPFAAFAATLRPPVRRDPRTGQPTGIAGPGHADEIWLHWIGRKHGRERHGLTEWSALVDGYRDEPAHPSVLMR